jgi:hypothetical protein
MEHEKHINFGRDTGRYRSIDYRVGHCISDYRVYEDLAVLGSSPERSCLDRPVGQATLDSLSIVL